MQRILFGDITFPTKYSSLQMSPKQFVYNNHQNFNSLQTEQNIRFLFPRGD